MGESVELPTRTDCVADDLASLCSNDNLLTGVNFERQCESRRADPPHAEKVAAQPRDVRHVIPYVGIRSNGLYDGMGRMESECEYSTLSLQEAVQHDEWTQQLHRDVFEKTEGSVSQRVALTMLFVLAPVFPNSRPLPQVPVQSGHVVACDSSSLCTSLLPSLLLMMP